MESLCKIELCGYIGNASINTVGNSKLARFSLATEYAYTSQDGTCVIDTTWFNCSCWMSDTIKCLDKIQKGKVAHLTGRVRMARYTDATGTERQIWEVVCQTIEISEP